MDQRQKLPVHTKIPNLVQKVGSTTARSNTSRASPWVLTLSCWTTLNPTCRHSYRHRTQPRAPSGWGTGRQKSWQILHCWCEESSWPDFPARGSPGRFCLIMKMWGNPARTFCLGPRWKQRPTRDHIQCRLCVWHLLQVFIFLSILLEEFQGYVYTVPRWTRHLARGWPKTNKQNTQVKSPLAKHSVSVTFSWDEKPHIIQRHWSKCTTVSGRELHALVCWVRGHMVRIENKVRTGTLSAGPRASRAVHTQTVCL